MLNLSQTFLHYIVNVVGLSSRPRYCTFSPRRLLKDRISTKHSSQEAQCFLGALSLTKNCLHRIPDYMPILFLLPTEPPSKLRFRYTYMHDMYFEEVRYDFSRMIKRQLERSRVGSRAEVAGEKKGWVKVLRRRMRAKRVRRRLQ